MATENIKSRKYYRMHNGTDWDRMHFVTDANSVDANDGDTMETKVGAIKGITTSTSVTEEGYAADATVVAALNDSLGGLEFTVVDGKPQWKERGADSFSPFSSGGWCAIGNCTIPETGNYHVYALGCAWCVDSWSGNRYAMTVSRNGTAIYSGSCFSTSSDSVPGTLSHSQEYTLNKGDSITYSISTGGQGKNIGSVLIVARVGS